MKSLYFLACLYFITPVFAAKMGLEGSYEKILPIEKSKSEQTDICNKSDSTLVTVAFGSKCDVSYKYKKMSDDQATQSIAN